MATLVFVGVTLSSVKPIDFCGVGRATELPLVGVSVPTNLFFYAAPVLVVAIYGYFHLYLIRLWDVLSDAPARIEGERLSDVAAPWLITDSALFIRQRWRDDGCTSRRALEWPNVVWNILLAWASGPFVLGYLWMKSLPARDIWMSGIAAAMIVGSLVFFISSATMLVLRMKQKPANKARELRDAAKWSALAWGIVAMFLASVTFQLTHHDGKRPATLNLVGEEVTLRPEGWVPYALTKVDFFQDWCKRVDEVPCKIESLDQD